jgi:hypothetical protein
MEMITLVILCCVAGLGCLRVRSIADPVRKGLDAYVKRDREHAADLARRQLKFGGDEDAGLRLLARALVRLGHDSAALVAY